MEEFITTDSTFNVGSREIYTAAFISVTHKPSFHIDQ